MNYYRRYVGDYLRDTARLSMIEHGAYNLLLDYYYADERPLPIDHQELYLMVRAMRPEDRKAVDKVLGLFFTKELDGYHQKRVDHEIDVSKKARDNGKGGGRPSTGSKTGVGTGNKTGSETGTLTGFQTEEGGGSGHPPTTNHQPPAASHQPPATKAHASRLPADWALPESWLIWTRTERTDWPLPYIHGVADQFRDYWVAKPGKDGTKLDWEATWRNWIRREKGPHARSTAAAGGGKQTALEKHNLSVAAGWKPPEAADANH